MYNICLVEDEKDLSELIKTYLENEKYHVTIFDKGKDAVDYIGQKVDLWILDIMLADDVNGYEIIKKIREQDEKVPVIFTSARDQDIDKIIGLELGSDDYLTKPFSTKELVLRIKKILKRVYESSGDKLAYEEYNIDLNKRLVCSLNEEINLTTLEFDLLSTLINSSGKSFSRDELLNLVWGNNYFGSDRVVDDLVRRLRKKMPNLKIETIYGYGYRLL